MDAVMITGATGLIGSNVCRILTERGQHVRALVRPSSETEPLAALGVELVEGDITSKEDVARAADGCGSIINSAALLGGAAQDMNASNATNYGGSVHCYDVARDGGRRVVELATTTFLRHEAPLTEHPEVVDDVPDDPYSVSKAAAFRDGQRRVAEGQDIVFLIPGGTFGPSPCPNRAMSTTSYNRLIRSALRGRIQEQISFPVPWVGAHDVASATVAALDSGKAGDAYLAFGREDATTTAAFLNLALDVAGLDQRVADISIAPGEEEAAIARYGETLVDLAKRQFPVPWFDNSYTRQQLGYAPMPLREAMEQTVSWLRQIGQM